MTHNRDLFLRPTHKNRRGQALVFIGLMMTALVGLMALVINYAMVYIGQNQLTVATQAAALAGAEAMSQPGATAASTTAAVTAYSSASGNANASSILSGASFVSGYPSLSCLTTLQNVYGVYCYGPGATNAIVVKQQATVPQFFSMFGAGNLTLTATATASMKGSSAGPYNIALVIDTTRSMTDTDSDSQCKSTRISCALAGVTVLLKNLSPCIWSQSSCGSATNGNVANSVDRVSLLVFPAVTTATASVDYSCSGTLATAAYATPFPATSTYQIVGFSSDYRASDTATSLTSTSDLVAAVGGSTGSPCIVAKGGYGTYYAQAIYAAQAYLVSEQSSYPNSQNVMILISDGDASATCTTSSQGVCTAGAMIGANTTSTTYPSTLQQCHQAIAAAQAAANAGTRVYAVAYGAEASGCSTDTNPSITPCETMQQIASSSGYFFSDYTATGGTSSCISASQPVSSLAQIFEIIAGDLSVAKIVPNGTT